MKKTLLYILGTMLVGVACSKDLPEDCTNNCADKNLCCAGLCCDAGEQCINDLCTPTQCDSGLQSCDGHCVDLNTDGAHCGNCTTQCMGGTECQGGHCVCAKGELCAEQCVDLSSDPLHCGNCTTQCPGSAECQGGRCVCAQGELCAEQCVDLSTDPLHCGECDRACGEYGVCEEGACVVHCPKGWEDCGGTCFDTSKTTRHCGGCYRVCELADFASEMYCENSQCRIMHCDDDARLCGDACKDVRNDAQNCGECGIGCKNNEICSEGQCQWAQLVWGSAGDDEILGMTQDEDGNLYVTGQTNGVFEDNLARGGTDAFLSKISKEGQVLWTKQWGTSGDDSGKAVVIGEDGFVYVGGSTTGSFDTLITTDGRSAFVSKFDTNGVSMLTKQFGTMYNDDLVSIAAAPTQGVYVAGHSLGALGAPILFGAEDIFILKVAGDGAVLWRAQYGSSKADTLAAMVVYKKKLYLMGTTYGAMHEGILPGNYISPNFVVIKAEDGGAAIKKEWIKEFGSPRADIGAAMMLRTEELEYKQDGVTLKKTTDVIYVVGTSISEKGANFDGHPTPNEGVGIAMVKLGEGGERLASMYLANEGKYYSAVALVQGFLKELPTEALYALSATEADSATSPAKALVWQMTSDGRILYSSAYVKGAQSRIRASVAAGDVFYVGGSTQPAGQSKQAYIEKGHFAL